MRTKQIAFFVILVCLSSVTAWAEEAKLNKMALGVNRTLPLKIGSKGRCMFGDYDLMAMDLNSTKTPSIILTVEPLNDGKPLSAVSLYEQGAGASILQEGHKVSLPLPADAPDQLLAVYICRDSIASGRCGDKPVVPFNESLQPYTQERPKDFEAPDKIYFFSLLILKGGDVYFPGELMSDDSLGRLPGQIRKLLPGTLDAAVFSKITALTKVIASEPMALGEGSILINLPHLDQQRGGQGRKKPIPGAS